MPADHNLSIGIRLEGGQDATRTIREIRAELANLSAQEKLLNEQFKNNANSLEAYTEKSENHRKRLEQLQLAYSHYKDISAQLRDKLEYLPRYQEELNKRTEQYATAIQSVNSKLEEDKEKTRQLTAEKQKWLDKIEAVTEGGKKQNSIVNIWKSNVDKLDKQIAETNKTTEAHQRQLDKLTEAQARNESELKALPQAQKDYQRQLSESEKQEHTYQLQILKTTAAYEDEQTHIKALQGDTEALAKVNAKEAEAAREAAEAEQKEAEALAQIASEFVNKKIVESYKALVSVLKECVEASKDFETSLTSVQKTSDFTQEELAEFSKQVKALATTLPITTNELNNIAEKAGQLGVAKEDLIGFTEIMAELGVSTNMTAEAASQSLAQIASITGMAADEYENLASTIVALGNNFATSESNIVAFTQRIAGTASNVGFTESQMLALATAVSSVGMQADAGGTAMQSLINKMQSAIETGDGLEAWADVMKMSTKELAELWRNNASEALLRLVQSLGKLDDGMVSTLKSLGVGEQRLIRTVTSLANAEEKTGLLTRALEMADTAWEENTALITEAGKRFDTTESKTILFENAINNLKIAIGDELNPALNEFKTAGASMVNLVTKLVQECPVLVDALTVLMVTLGGLSLSFVLASDAFTAFIAKFKASNIKTMFNPIGLAVTAVAALGTALVLLASRTDSVVESNNKFIKSIEATRTEMEKNVAATAEENDETLAMVRSLTELVAVEEKSAGDKALIEKLVSKLNEEMPSLNVAYDTMANRLYDINTGATLSAESINEMAEALAEQRLQEQKLEALTQLYIKRKQLQEELEEQQKNLALAQKEYNDTLVETNEYTGVNSEATAEATDKVNQYDNAVRKLKEELNLVNNTIDGYGGSSYVQSTKNSTQAMDDAHEAVQKLLAAHKELKKQLEATAKSAEEDIKQKVGGAFDYVAEASTKSHYKVMKALNSQIEYFKNAGNNLNNLMERNVDGLDEMLKQLQADGQLSAEMVATLAKMSDKELEDVVKGYNDARDAAKSWGEANAELATDWKEHLAEMKRKLVELRESAKTPVKVTVEYNTYGRPKELNSSTVYVKNAQGLEYVPYDDYAAMLHEGEMVLTKAEASAYRYDRTHGQSITTTNNNRNYGGVTLNVYAHQGQDVDKLADEIMYRIEDATKRKESTWA